MKRILSLILALSMLMSVTLTSCGKKDESGKKDEAKTEAAAKEEVHGNCKDGKSHSFVTSTAEADCTARGYTMNTCKTCGYVYLGDTSPALGHDWGDEVSVIPLGCTTDGKSEKTCRRCGMSSEHTVPHAGHVYELSAEEDVNGTVYVCTVCGDIITLNDGEELPLEKEESMYLPDRSVNFSFTVLCEDEDTLRASLTISGEKGKAEYKTTPDGDGRYVVSPANNYTEYGSYTASITGDASFENYNTDKLEFGIIGPDRADVEFKDDDIVFLKKLAEKNKAYSHRSVEWDEAAERYYVTLSGNVGIDDSYFGKVFAVGDYVSTEDVMKDPTRELVFGKLTGVTHNAKGKTVLEMTAPEISDVFSEYDLYFSGGADSAEPLTLLASDEELELEFAEAVVMSDGFAEYMTTVQLAAGDYADDHGLEVVPLGAKKDGGFKFELTDKSIKTLENGNGAQVKLGGKITYKIDLKEKLKKLDAGSVTVTCYAGLTSVITIGGDFEDNEKAELSVQNTTNVTLQFSVNFELDYNQNFEEKYYVHSKTNKIHTSSCRIVKGHADKDKLTAYTAEELAKKYNGDKAKMAKNECKICYAVTTLDGTGYILNKDSKVLHCMDCMHVKTIKDCNIYTVYPANTIGFTTCKTCKPEERQTKDFEARMLNKINGGDMENELNAFRKSAEEVFGKSGADDIGDYSLSLPINICGVMNVELGVKPVFEFEIKATVDFTVSATTSSTVGIRSKGKDGGFETYKSQEKPTVDYELTFMGEADAKLGIALSVKAYPVGFEKAAVIQVTGKIGAYAHLTGIFTTSGSVGGENDTYSAARLDVGLFLDVDGYWKILWFDGDFTIVDDKRQSLINWGYDRVYYSFVDEETEVNMGSDLSIDLTDYCNANYLNLSTLKKETGYITERDLGRFKMNVECQNEDGSPCDYLKFSGKTWTVDRTATAPDSFTAYIYVTFESRLALDTIGEFLGSHKYGTIYAYTLDPLVIKVTADKSTGAPGQNVTTPGQTITVPKGGKTIGMGIDHLSVLKTDGTVVTIKSSGTNTHLMKVDTSTWTDIVSICVGEYFTAGLKTDGTVVYSGLHSFIDPSSWTNIVAISAGLNHLVGLKSDGTVVVTGKTGGRDYNKKFNLSSWKDISYIYCCNYHTLGIKSDGSVVHTEHMGLNMSDWTDIVALHGTDDYILGLKSDGTVVSTGDNGNGQCNVSEWVSIVAISTSNMYSDEYSIGVKLDGSIVITKHDGYLNNPLLSMNNVVDVVCNPYPICLKADGTIEFADTPYFSAEDLALLHDIALPTR